MNLDFDAEPLFSWYVVLLAISGLALLVLGAVNLGGLKIGWRILNVLVGLGFTGYAYYLAFVFEGGTYTLFFKAFILPVALIANAVKALVTRSQEPAAPVAPPVPAGSPYQPQPAAPYGQGAPVPQASPYQPQGYQAPQGQAYPQAQPSPYQPQAYPQAYQAPQAPQGPQQG
ncbi:hypothetical protein ABT093_37595 [Kitasatospora sp. NPDC002551]|uniref:hypothetical protein n=1 Tax=unclassified Kitasatospora TaxID=2633591 RepID=UPI003318708E